MNHKIFKEEQILDDVYRKEIIKEIEGKENYNRKKKAKIRYDIYKDGTKKYVIERLKSEFEDKEDIKDIINRVSNISFLKKIIDKKALVYKKPPKRTVVGKNLSESEKIKRQEQIDYYCKELKLNKKMKSVNKTLELQRNCAVSVKPYMNAETEKWRLNIQVYYPFLYDVIEDANNHEIPRCYILSYLSDRSNENYTYSLPNESGNRESPKLIGSPELFRDGDGINQRIADSPNDAGAEKKEYIWWSHKYHLTTNEKGERIKVCEGEDEKGDNPIKNINFVDFAKDRDGEFWAVGGDDLVDSAIFLNTIISDMHYSIKYQAMGLFYIWGANVPSKIKVGPAACISMTVKEGDPEPGIGFANPSPAIQEQLRAIEQYVALTLTTNNLEPGNISGELTTSNAQSGIQEMIRMSENVEDREDQQQEFIDKEVEVIRLVARWHNLYLSRNILDDDLTKLGEIDEKIDYNLELDDPKPYVSDKEKLEIIKIRREIGLDSIIDSIMRDNKNMSRVEAEQRYKKLLEEKITENMEKIKQEIREQKLNDRKEGNEKDEENR